jgi:DNA-binding response OmpR family regulator
MSLLHLLLVEDEVKLRDSISRGLSEEDFRVRSVGSAEAAADALARTAFDVMVLDLRLPGKDGITWLRELRAAGNTTPVLILTARGSVGDRVTGLESGADDYLVKPFAFAELLARIRALTRRRNVFGAVLKVADMELDTTTRRVRRAGEEVNLSPKETLLLELLMRNAGQAVTRSMITEVLCGPSYNDLSNLIEVFVNRLRRKIGDNDASLIATIRGTGYCMRRAR